MLESLGSRWFHLYIVLVFIPWWRIGHPVQLHFSFTVSTLNAVQELIWQQRGKHKTTPMSTGTQNSEIGRLKLYPLNHRAVHLYILVALSAYALNIPDVQYVVVLTFYPLRKEIILTYYNFVNNSRISTKLSSMPLPLKSISLQFYGPACRNPNCRSNRAFLYFMIGRSLFEMVLSSIFPTVSIRQIGWYNDRWRGCLLDFGIKTSASSTEQGKLLLSCMLQIHW